MEQSCNKMILAVISGDDYSNTVQHLNNEGIYATILSSTGGFLRKKSITLMIGVEAEKLETALSIIKAHAGERVQTTIVANTSEVGLWAYPIKVHTGGSVVFVMDIEKCIKF